MTTTTGDSGGSNTGERPPLMDIEEVARRLSVGVRHVRRLVTEKRIPYRKWGHLLRFERDEIEEWIEATKVPVRPPADWPQIGGGRRLGPGLTDPAGPVPDRG
jgi:excisionase family DNA binding protein